MRRALALVAGIAGGLMACSRTELELANGLDASTAHTQIKDGGGDAQKSDATSDDGAKDGACQWTFAPEITYLALGYPVGVAIGDFDADARPDILMVNRHMGAGAITDNIRLLFNNGDGTFTRTEADRIGFMPYAFALGDFSGDGQLDLAAIYEYQAPGVSNQLDVFFSLGDGSFGPAASYDINGGGFALSTGDFNGDGALDIAVIDAKTRLSVLSNRGDGTFAPRTTFDAGLYADTLTTGDFNGDGVLDIATGGSFAENVLINRGNGTFAAPVTYPYSADCNYLGQILASDINGDGYPELIRSCFQGGSFVATRTNTKNGALGDEVTSATGSWPWGMVAADFTGHGHNDLAVANSFAYANSVSILPNTGGVLTSQVTYAAKLPNFIAAGDLNGDGHADLVTAGGTAITVLLSQCE